MRVSDLAIVIITLLLAQASPGGAQEKRQPVTAESPEQKLEKLQQEELELRTLTSRTPVSLATIRTMPGLVGLTFIDVRKRFLAVATRTVVLTGSRFRGVEPPWRELQESEGGSWYVLHFYRREGGQFFKIAESQPGHLFVGMSPELGRETTRLHTYWETGSAEVLITFAIYGDQIAKVFSYGGKLSPELVQLANDGQIYLAVADGELYTAGDGRTIYPKTASIYAWEVSRYVLKKRVPWESRLDALRDLWPREYPKE